MTWLNGLQEGSPDVLQLGGVETPTVKIDEVVERPALELAMREIGDPSE